MATRIKYLFPDTNLFIQCRPLEELDWSAWKEFDEVHLIVSRPVQREIDNQKNRRNGRVGKQARKTSSLFREIIADESDHKLIRDAAPQVRLLFEPSCLPSPELADRLDFDKPDDELVGCLHAYLAKNPDVDARIITHDTGPMGTAKMLDLKFVVIPDDWLIPPENTDAERKIKHLEIELARSRKAEPDFHIKCVDDEGNKIDRLEFEHITYEALTDNEILEFIDSLKTRFLLATDFGSREPAERERRMGTVHFAGTKDIYTPVSDEAITEYTETKFPVWIEKCKEALQELHKSLQIKEALPNFCFVASNEGTRPGKDVLITIETKGNFKIRPPVRKDDEEGQENSNSEKKIELPPPPSPPKGEWKMEFGNHRLGIGSTVDAMEVFRRSLSPYSVTGSILNDGPDFKVPLFHPFENRHDPNGIYWKPRRPMRACKSFSLECDKWRHGIEDEYFQGEIIFGRNTDDINGALECRIHAGNLSATAKKIIPVRITIAKISVRKRADELIADLIIRAG
jgi:hypothetical protein